MTPTIVIKLALFISMIILCTIRIIAKRGITKFLSISLIYFLIALFVMHVFMLKWGFRGDISNFGFNYMMTYKAAKPWAYRVFIPILVNTSSELIPKSFIESNADFLVNKSPINKYVQIKETWNAQISLKYHLTFFYVLLSLFLLLFSLRYLTKLIFEFPSVVEDMSPAVGLLLLPLTFIRGGYFYDFPELLFMVLCLICIIKKKWIFYYLVFFLAILNKESNILLVLFFIAYREKIPSKSIFLRHMTAQIIMGGVINLVIRAIFASHPGNPIWNNLIGNLKFWAHPKYYFMWFDPYFLGINIFPRGGNIILVLIVLFLIFYKWQEKPLHIKRIFLYSMITMFPLFIIGGYRDEIRTLSLLFPSIYLLGTYSVYKLIKGHSKNNDLNRALA